MGEREREREMALLETEVFQQDPFGYNINGCNKDFHALVGGGGTWSYGYVFPENDMNIQSKVLTNDNKILGQGFNNVVMDLEPKTSRSSMVQGSLNDHQEETNFSSAEKFAGNYNLDGEPFAANRSFSRAEIPAATTGRRKRRRIKTIKNKEEVENQRMTHIAVERNRRKQMNDYLAILRSMMPSSYVQRVLLLFYYFFLFTLMRPFQKSKKRKKGKTFILFNYLYLDLIDSSYFIIL